MLDSTFCFTVNIINAILNDKIYINRLIVEISEFAKELLFAETLSGKLDFSKETFSDHNSKIAWKQPVFPGRPMKLRPGKKELRARFPSLSEMGTNDWSRGAVIHFFANHELLAIEIMALALLKFVDAPPKFRMSLVQTILEEQKHMSLYLKQMSVFGIEFGEIAVSDFFWNCCKEHETPAQFLSAVSLTFEQANLDYCTYYRDVFSKIGDHQTAEVLQKVYLDEIGHVKNGVFWINTWKKKNESIWDFYTNHLTWPLTAQRAKGIIFDKEGRKHAGLDDDFQQALLQYGHSKGKVPDIWSFVPGSEWEVAGKKRPKVSNVLQKDLGPVLLWIAGPDDIVVLEAKPDKELLNKILKFRNRLPQYILRKKINDLVNRKTGCLKIWSFSKNSVKDFEKILSSIPVWQKKRIENLAVDYSFGFHRNRSIELETRLSKIFDYRELLFCPGVIASRNHIAGLSGNEMMVAKAVYSSSGKGLFFFNSAEEFHQCPFRHEPEILFEKYLPRLVDLSFLYDCDPAGNYFNKAITRFYTTQKGTYKSHIVGNYTHGLDGNILKALHKRYDGKTLIFLVREAIRKLLPENNPNYRGPVGVDAMIVELDGQILFRPVVEINYRYTMGHYSHALKKYLAPGKTGLFQIQSIRTLQKTSYKLVNGKLDAGQLILTDLEDDPRFAAVLSVV